MFLLLISLTIISYLLGSLNSAIILVRTVFKRDIRDYGSGNAGATNVYRTFGGKYGLIVFVFDALKGLLAVNLVYFFPNIADVDCTTERIQLQIVLGVAVMLGHIYPIYYNFKGGKGVATVLGIIMGINLFVALGLLAIFIAVVASTSYISLGSMVAALAFPFIVFLCVDSKAFLFLIFSAQVACFIFYTHRKNISRLVKGEENKFILRR